MSKHTPGPWYSSGMADGTVVIAAGTDLAYAYWYIARVHSEHLPPDTATERRAQAVANASLIAAAPELLSELRLRCRQLGRIALACLQDHDGDARAIAEELDIDFSIDDGPTVKSEAIAKAEGK